VVQTARDFGIDPSTCALNGGEDYELLFTVSINDHDKIKNNPDITVIGHMTKKDAGYNIVTRDGKQYALTAQGWDALLKKSS
jgi:thiamine-monophosphate kinase